MHALFSVKRVHFFVFVEFYWHASCFPIISNTYLPIVFGEALLI